MTVGDRVKELREKKGWSQGQLLRQARQFLPAGEAFARATLSRIENGHRKANSGVLQALARALDTSPEYLLGLDGQEDLVVASAEDISMPQPELAAIVARILPLKAGQRHQVCVVTLAPRCAPRSAGVSDLLTALQVPPAAAEDESAADQALREVARSRATRSAVLQQQEPVASTV